MAGEEKFRKLRAKMNDLENSLQDRLTDAEVLFLGGRFASVIAMGIYALEIHLKVKICQRLDLDALPQAFEIHDLDALLHLAGLKRRLDDPASIRVRYNWDQITSQQFNVNELRYMPAINYTQPQAADFLQSLRDAPDGVMPWLLAQP
jgi:hypothetical protein